MSIPRDEPKPRRDHRRPADDGDYRMEGSFACLDSEWDEVTDTGGGFAGGFGTSKRYGGAE